jgi:hypothetical protein
MIIARVVSKTCCAAGKNLLAGLVLCLCVPLYAQSFIDAAGQTVETRIVTPPGYERVSADENSFTAFLRTLQVLPDGSLVRYYDGSVKPNNDTYVAVVNLDVGLGDLQQAAEMCMRLRGEYLFRHQKYDKIAFSIMNNKRIFYTDWVKGLKIVIDGKSYWTKTDTDIDRYRTFRRYLDFIFTHADIETLNNDVQRVLPNDLQPGDMFIQGTHPGHAVMVIDVAENSATGDRIFLLAQSYKPAQECQILVNPNDQNLSPWYSMAAIDTKIVTPEFIFYKRDLRRFREVSSSTPKKRKGPIFYF